MKKTVLIVAILGFVLATTGRLYALSSDVDLEALKEEIKKEIRNERPWQDEIASWKIDIHGFVSQGFMNTSANNFLANDSSSGSFHFDEMAINFSKDLTDKLRIGLQLFAHDLGAIGNNDIMIDWAFADYHWQDWLGLRAGKIKSPHGLYNESRDVDLLRTSIFLPQSVYTELNRESMVAIQGLGLYGNIPLNAVGSFAYYLLGGTMDVEGSEDNGAVRQANNGPLFEVAGDFDMKEVYIGSLEWHTPLAGLLLKTTYRKSRLDIPAETKIDLAGGFIPAGAALTYEIGYISTVVYSIEYTLNDLVLAAEYQNTRRDYSINLDDYGITLDDGMATEEGYYFSAAYRFTDWFETGLYYSKYYSDTADKDGQDQVASGAITYNYQAWLKDTALSLRFDITDNWIFKLEGHRMDGAAFVLGLDNDDFEKDWYLLAAKVTFSF